MSSRPAMPSPDPETVEAATDGDLASAKRVLGIEAAAITALAASLGKPFLQALDIMAAVKGRVVVTGMGKSGHVATKIAATLSSTGTPALFVHPAEASHGDLGMITKDDALFALSNSGETSELADMVAYAKRFGIPLIAVTSGADSALDKAADVSLVLPKSEEACPMGLAPTTSTTVMMALGDAISVALLERKGFSSDQFHVLHPGGKLGRLLIKVSEIMHTGDELPLIEVGTPMADALIEMTTKSFGCVGIADAKGMLMGVITDGDLRRHMSPDLLGRDSGDVMTKGVQTMAPEMLASEALAIMNSRSITNIFVTEGGRAIGILHIHDCLRAGVA
ncbi:MAG: KpsF/GutQ family sugar-phosphate isomerase [Proteobacteria bacterium]|nr:KpsF/GutQ family sugar-phosphate isomerase [Pseudomonadota bacterium]